MDRTKDISGVEVKPRFSPKEPSVKVLVHQAGTVLGYDKVVPDLAPRPQTPDVRVSAPPAAPEPSQKRAGERFGPIELPDSVKRKYDTRPLGTLPLHPEPGATKRHERGAEPAHEPVPARVLPFPRKQRPVMLGAMLIVSVIASVWGAAAFMREGSDETSASPGPRATAHADVKPVAQQATSPRLTAKPITRNARPIAPAEAPEPATAASTRAKQNQRVAPHALRRMRTQTNLRTKAPEVEMESPPNRVEANSAPSQTPPSKEANDLMLGQW